MWWEEERAGGLSSVVDCIDLHILPEVGFLELNFFCILSEGIMKDRAANFTANLLTLEDNGFYAGAKFFSRARFGGSAE